MPVIVVGPLVGAKWTRTRFGVGVSENVLFDPWLSTPAVNGGEGPVITSTPNTATLCFIPTNMMLMELRVGLMERET